jgi:ubiquinone biosynthesis protein UbiJ
MGSARRDDRDSLGELTDPLAARFAGRVLEGQIHMLEAQIVQLTEIADRLREQEKALTEETAAPGTAEVAARRKEGSP